MNLSTNKVSSDGRCSTLRRKNSSTAQSHMDYSFFFKAASFSRMKLWISSAIPRSFSHCSR
jgi:hypothetical protein